MDYLFSDKSAPFFHSSPYVEDGLHCLMCSKVESPLYCENCVTNGEFKHSDEFNLEDFSFRKKRYFSIKKRNLNLLQDCDVLLSQQEKIIKIKSEILILKNKNKAFKSILLQTKKKISDMKDARHKLQCSTEEKSKKIDDYIPKMKAFVDRINDRQVVLDVSKKNSDVKLRSLDELRNVKICQLTKYIFPIYHVKSNDSTVKRNSLIMHSNDTYHPAFINGRWVLPVESCAKELRIVSSFLPIDGDYSEYRDWVTTDVNMEVPGSSAKDHSVLIPSHNISAALTYTSQLVEMLAYYLDVWLPAKVSYRDFCCNQMTKNKCNRKVAQLNSNIMHLCLSQNVSFSLLTPNHTLSNIIVLLDKIESSKETSFKDLYSRRNEIFETALYYVWEMSNSGSSSNEDLSYDWEAIPSTNGLPESEPCLPQRTRPQLITSNSITGGLISSAVSIASYFGWKR